LAKAGILDIRSRSTKPGSENLALLEFSSMIIKVKPEYDYAYFYSALIIFTALTQEEAKFSLPDEFFCEFLLIYNLLDSPTSLKLRWTGIF